MYRIMYKYAGDRKAQSAVVYDEKLDALVEAQFTTVRFPMSMRKWLGWTPTKKRRGRKSPLFLFGKFMQLLHKFSSGRTRTAARDFFTLVS